LVALTAVPAARLVLQDVMYVRAMLEDEPRHVEWRLSWILAVVLLRSVGHVLNNVDGTALPAVKALANKLHAEWKGREPLSLTRFSAISSNASATASSRNTPPR
jgi:hypothetical protein